MQHANLHVALAADIADEFPKGQPLTLSGSRSPRTEMALRELANLQVQIARLAVVIEADHAGVSDSLCSGQSC